MKKLFFVALLSIITPSLAVAVDWDTSIDSNESSYSGNQWSVTFPYGTVSGTGRVTIGGCTFYTGDDIDESSCSGDCVCQVTSPGTSIEFGANYSHIEGYSDSINWRDNQIIPNYTIEGCARDCTDLIGWDQDTREAVYPTIVIPFTGEVTVTTQTYVDNLLNTKQAKITTTGTNKLMTYGASTGATPGSRDIVSTLGTSTTATTVPETGPIVAGINSKQDAVNGTANYVMTGTGTAGTVGEKPVYSATTNYPNALVTAQTINTATANAANSELTCVDNDCLLWQISATTPRAMSTIPGDPSINGTDNCYRRAKNTSSLGNQAYYNGTCSADTLSYLGTNYSYSGRWGVVLPYGDISGVSVCAGNGASHGTVATDVQSVALDAALASGQQPNTSHGCWCKMENPMPSRWVFYDDVGNYPWDKCALQCASTIKSNTFQMRTIMYNNPQ